MAATMFLSCAVPVAVMADCGPDLTDHVVFLEVPHSEYGDDRVIQRSGVLVSDSGLVVTSFSLIGEAGYTPAGLLSDDERLTVSVWSGQRQDNSTPEAGGLVIGYDWRRDLLLVKLPADDVDNLELQAAPLSSEPIRSVSELCVVGFTKIGNNYDSKERPESFKARLASGVNWNLDGFAPQNSEIGGAVLDEQSGHLVGILVGTDEETEHFLPIEFADTLLSQVYISRIFGDLKRFEEFSKGMQDGILWDFDVLENEWDGVTTSFRIRFFFTPLDPKKKVQRVEMSTSLWGSLEGVKNQSVDLPDPVKNERIEEGINYVDYDAFGFIEKAIDQGFSSVERIQIRLIPKFEERPGRQQSEPRPQRFTSYDFPLDFDLSN